MSMGELCSRVKAAPDDATTPVRVSVPLVNSPPPVEIVCLST